MYFSLERRHNATFHPFEKLDKIFESIRLAKCKIMIFSTIDIKIKCNVNPEYMGDLERIFFFAYLLMPTS